MPTCAKCGEETGYSLSPEHPAPYQNQYLCVNCYNQIDFGISAKPKPKFAEPVQPAILPQPVPATAEATS
jgi:hypothetical protein